MEDLSEKATELWKLYNSILDKVEINTSIQGRKARDIFYNLLSRGKSFEDLKLIINALVLSPKFELYWLYNEDYFQKILKVAKDLEKVSGFKVNLEGGYEEILDSVYRFYIEPHIEDIIDRKITYQEVLKKMPFLLDPVQYWLIVDPVYLKMSRVKLIDQEIVTFLRPLRQKKNRLQSLKEAFNRILDKHPDLSRIIKTELEVLNEYMENL